MPTGTSGGVGGGVGNHSAYPIRTLVGDGIEAELGKAQTVVVVIPEEVLVGSVEDSHACVTTRRGVGVKAERRELLRVVLELALAFLTDQHDVLRGADDLAGGGIGRAGGDLRVAAGLAERPGIDA